MLLFIVVLLFSIMVNAQCSVMVIAQCSVIVRRSFVAPCGVVVRCSVIINSSVIVFTFREIINLLTGGKFRLRNAKVIPIT